jgi:hypothetical protein
LTDLRKAGPAGRLRSQDRPQALHGKAALLNSSTLPGGSPDLAVGESALVFSVMASVLRTGHGFRPVARQSLQA